MGLPNLATQSQPYILVVDDDADYQLFFSETFQKSHPESGIKILDSGQQALAYLRSCSPEEGPALILLDYEMPQMTGGDLLRSLTTIGWLAAIPKVLWSHSSRYFVRCEGLGVREFIIKPESQESMESVAGEVARIMNTKQPK